MEQTDILTGLPNGTKLNSVIDAAVKQEQDMAIALLDIDYFSHINERFGQNVGDKVIVAVASLLNRELPGKVYRIGGDEFAVAMPSLTLEQAFLNMEQCRLKIEAEITQGVGLATDAPVTVTIGVAQFPRDAKQKPALMKAVDAALLAAKEHSRNCVGLPPSEEMIVKSCYYPAASVRKLKALSEQRSLKESVLLREALADLLRKYDAPSDRPVSWSASTEPSQTYRNQPGVDCV